MKNTEKKILIAIFIILTILIYLGLFIVYGPIYKFRDWLINTALSTREHKNLAHVFYDDETISDSLVRNSILSFDFATNLYDVKIVDYSKQENIEYEDEYDKQILDEAKTNKDYKLIEISGEKYSRLSCCNL